jgi:septal ring factor EnvC (AmiA/AmiB activator)
MDHASEALFTLKPVTFRYKKELDPESTAQFGLVAEQVDNVNPDLVVRDKEGKPYSVRYDQVNAMLLNEFLKEHRKNEQQETSVTELKSTVAKQQAIIAQQRKDFEAAIANLERTVAAQLKEQAAQIQRMSAQLEVSKFATGRIRRGGPAPQVVANKP